MEQKVKQVPKYTQEVKQPTINNNFQKQFKDSLALPIFFQIQTFSYNTNSNNPSDTSNRFLFVSNEIAPGFFKEVLCNEKLFSLDQLNHSGFICFTQYMGWLQQYLKKADYKEEINNPDFAMLWKILQTESPIQHQAVTFMVELIYKLTIKYVANRKQIIENVLENALLRIKNFSEESQIKTFLELIDIIIERFELLKIASINSSYHTPPLLNFNLIVSGGTPHNLSINSGMTLLHLKNLVSNSFGIHRSLIRLLIPSKNIDLTDKYDSYSLNTLHSSSEGKLELQIKKHVLSLEETPRYVLANSKLLGQLTTLLHATNEEIANGVWSLLQSLPQNEAIKDKLKSILAEKKANWESYFFREESIDSPSIIYDLYLLSELIISQKPEKDTKLFRDQFSNQSGYEFLQKIFKELKKDLSNKFNLKSMIYVLKLMTHLMVFFYCSPDLVNKNYSFVFQVANNQQEQQIGCRIQKHQIIS